MRVISTHRRWLSLLALAPLSLVLAAAPAQAATTIDFEGTDAPVYFVDTTPLTNRYSDLGVTFSGANGSAPGSILNVLSSFGIGARSGTDFLAFNGLMLDRSDPLNQFPAPFSERISFNNAAMNFSLFVGGRFADSFTASFFDQANKLLETQTIDLAPQAYGELSRAGLFSSVVIASTADFWVADDLSFDLIVAPVPEPATWLTMLLGFGIIGGVLRRRRKFAPQQV